MIRDDASERQVQAADPDLSTWLSANAGSGKTRVLTDRVARLLLNGVLPQHILCLTYTKAAASEMQNRLFKRLGEWAMLESNVLRGRLRDLGLDQSLDDAKLRLARQLFARAIETPGGLKIQTIHSFCASLLRRFPLEAGVSPRFVEMDDRAALRLREGILEDLAEGPERAVFDAVAQLFTGEDLRRLTQEIAKHRGGFQGPPDAAALWRHFGIAPGQSEGDVLAAVFLGSEQALMDALLPILREGSINDVKAAEKLGGLDLANPGLPELSALEGVFLTGPGAKEPFSAKIGSFPTKDTRTALADNLPSLNDLMARVESAREARLALRAAQKTLALHNFAAAFLPEYEARKLRHGWLDFDDLIFKARDLLTDPSVAEWVLFRLDGGIDHILVDEAQDTSPPQWQVIDLLSREFTAGQGTHIGAERTLFVVGDKKQSIYSFQGADPDGFDKMLAQFAGRMQSGTNALQELQLEYSFRSATGILSVVDNTFHQDARRGLGKDVLHRAFKSDMPGRVDLWPVIVKGDEPEKPDWSDPVDTLAPEHPTLQLAQRIATELRRMIGGETLWHRDGQRPVRAGDVLILLRRRSALFHEIIRACKAEGLPIAGADRLKIGGELAVKDLSAVLAFLATPEDDLSLACALKSPLFGWDERALYDLAAGRGKKYLWAALREHKEAYAETYAMLSALRSDADFLRPFDLIERILTRHDGRRRLIARLGPEAEDGIDALLSQALAYERIEVPSLTGFLTWLESGEVEIKRQMDSAGDRIRVMTVHGAKGLEAPVVILPDTAQHRARNQDEILTGEGGVPLWKTATGDSPSVMRAAQNALSESAEDERQRLLYVAMTRAEQWLIVCAAGELGKSGSWYDKIADGMARVGAVDFDFPFGRGQRVETGAWGAGALHVPDVTAPPTPILSTWAIARADTPDRPDVTISPSGLGGEKALQGEGAALSEEEAKARGTYLHLLLEHLPQHPQADWPGVALRLLSGKENGPDEAEISALLAETETVLTAPALRDMFAKPALCEVEVTAHLPDLGQGALYGAIDRLIVEDERVLIIDYKSNAIVPERAEDTPEGVLRQMGAYAAALARIYPERRIETAILWTRSAKLMHLPPPLVAAALQRANPS